jgi:hypothetical protein
MLSPVLKWPNPHPRQPTIYDSRHAAAKSLQLKFTVLRVMLAKAQFVAKNCSANGAKIEDPLKN